MAFTHRDIRERFFFALLLGVMVLTFLLFLPYVVTLAIAATFAVILQPVYRWFLVRFKGIASLSAVCTIIVTGIVLLVPLSILGTKIVSEATNVYTSVSENPDLFAPALIGKIEGLIREYIPGFSLNLQQYAGSGAKWMAGSIGAFFSGTASAILHFFLGMLAFYYFLKDGHSFIRSIIAYSPLDDAQDKKILHRLDIAINSIIRGSLSIALIQGILAGVGMAIFGLPSPALWGSVAAVSSLIPSVGTAAVFIPAVLYLFFSGSTFPAIGLAVWGILAVGMIDNLLGPYLVGRGVKIHPMLILFGVLGGIGFFGPVGFLLGPLVLSLLFALLDIYKTLLEHRMEKSAL